MFILGYTLIHLFQRVLGERQFLRPTKAIAGDTILFLHVGVCLSPWSFLNVRLERINIKHTLTVKPAHCGVAIKAKYYSESWSQGSSWHRRPLHIKLVAGWYINSGGLTELWSLGSPCLFLYLWCDQGYAQQSPALSTERGRKTQPFSLLTFWCPSQYPLWFDSQAPLLRCHTFLIFSVVTETEATGVCN